MDDARTSLPGGHAMSAIAVNLIRAGKEGSPGGGLISTLIRWRRPPKQPTWQINQIPGSGAPIPPRTLADALDRYRLV